MPRGGKRPGAGRPKGSHWKPASTDLRAMAKVWSSEVVGTARDPLGFLIATAADDAHPIAVRLNAASIAVGFLYPKLSAATVESHSTVTRVDGRALIDQLEARIARSVPLIEADAHTDADAAQEVPSASTDDDREAA
jgi:hypothetical protein